MKEQNKKQQRLVQRFYEKYKGYIFDDYPAKHHKQLLDFQQLNFSKNGIQQDEEFNQWMFQQNSANKRIYCIKDNVVIGQQSAMAIPLKVGNKVINATYAMDLRVSEEWKMRGIGVALVRKLINNFDVLIGLGVSDEAYNICEKFGWVNLGTLNFYIKPITFKGGMSNERKAGVFRFIISAVVLFWSNTLDFVNKLKTKKIRVKRIEKFEEEHVRLHDYLVWPEGISIDRSLEYLNWRFICCPSKNKYIIHEVRDRQNKLIGYFTIKIVSWKNKKALCVVDLQLIEQKMDDLLMTIIDIAKRASVDLILFQLQNHYLEKHLSKHAFYKRPHGDKFIFYCEDPELTKVLKNKQCWNINFFESDMDFCFYKQ